jgi:hypothetical protein
MKDKKLILVTAMMALLLVGTFGVYMYNLGATNTKYQLIQEDFGAGDGGIKGYITWTLIHEDGTRVPIYANHNAITTAGLNAIRTQIGGTPSANFTWIAIGTGTGGTTTLNAEIFRASGTYATGTDGVWTVTYTWVAGTFSGQTVTEAGTFNDPSAGTMLNYQTFSGITLTATDSLEVEMEFTVS